MRLEDVRLGMRVRVPSGPYRGRVGVVLEARQDLLRDIVTVLLDDWQWPVTFKPDELEPAEEVRAVALEWLDEIEARAKAATPGPWGRNKYGGIGAGEFYIHPVLINIEGWEECTDADLEFIAHARSDVPKLCRAVRELYEMLAEALPYLETHATPGADYLATEARKVLERWERGGD